jgi:hypothetical protein
MASEVVLSGNLSSDKERVRGGGAAIVTGDGVSMAWPPWAALRYQGTHLPPSDMVQVVHACEERGGGGWGWGASLAAHVACEAQGNGR